MSDGAPIFAWRVRQVMALRDIRTQRALRRALAQQGHLVSAAQLNRVVNGPPECLNLRLLRGLCDVLACDVGDLLTIPGRRLRPIDPLSTLTAPTAAAPVYEAPEFDEELGPDLYAYPRPEEL